MWFDTSVYGLPDSIFLLYTFCMRFCLFKIVEGSNEPLGIFILNFLYLQICNENKVTLQNEELVHVKKVACQHLKGAKAF